MSGCLVVHFSWLRRAPGGRRRSPRASSRRATALPGSARHRAQALPSTPAHRSSLALFAVLLWQCCGCGSSVAPALLCLNLARARAPIFFGSVRGFVMATPGCRCRCRAFLSLPSPGTLDRASQLEITNKSLPRLRSQAINSPHDFLGVPMTSVYLPGPPRTS